MPALQVAAPEVFQILRAYNYTVMLWDADGGKVTEPAEARRMFAAENLLVSLVEAGDNSAIRLAIGRSTDPAEIADLIQALRAAANKFNLLFNLRQYGKEINPKDFAHDHQVAEASVPRIAPGGRGRSAMTTSISQPSPAALCEGMYGTTRSSYLRLEQARMIVRHRSSIDPSLPGARGRCIECILIENANGERLRFPTQQLAPARAMTQHVNQGGCFTDALGEQIINLAEDYHKLGKCVRHIRNNAAHLAETAQTVHGTCRTALGELRSVFERLARPTSYATEAERLGEQALLETDADRAQAAPEQLAELRTMLTTEARGLDETILECVWRYTKPAERDQPEPVTEAGRFHVPADLVQVLGRAVNRDAWDELKAGKLPMAAVKNQTAAAVEHDVQHGRFGNPNDELLMKAAHVAELAKDDTMSGLLSHVVEELPVETDPLRRRQMRAIARAAVAAAGFQLGAGNLAQNHPVVREFIEWFDRFDLARVLPEGRELLLGDAEDDDAEASYPIRDSDADAADDAAAPVLSPEDILLPDDNENASLAREVVPVSVTDPQSGRAVAPDSAYLAQLRALSGLSKDRY